MRSSSRSSSLSRETHDGRDPVTKSRRRRVAVLTTAASLDVEQPREPEGQQVLSHNENGKGSPVGKTTTRCLHQTTQTQGINCRSPNLALQCTLYKYMAKKKKYFQGK